MNFLKVLHKLSKSQCKLVSHLRICLAWAIGSFSFLKKCKRYSVELGKQLKLFSLAYYEFGRGFFLKPP
jgi:hypothetical protein